MHPLVVALRCGHHKPRFDIHQSFHVDDVIAQEIRTLVGYTVCMNPLTQLFKELVGLGKHAFEGCDDSKANRVPSGAMIYSWCPYFWWEYHILHLRFTF